MNFNDIQLILYAALGIAVFMILREFWCWYFKINERIVLMKEQNRLLRKVLGEDNDKTDTIGAK
jgi:hypothetical protein